MESGNFATVLLGGGCFWCTEAIFDRVKGIKSVVSGYSGGSRKNPTYEEVCSGKTGHAEVIKIDYDPNEISFTDILEIFFQTHDPTSLNRQGADVGEQYRSVIFYSSVEQKEISEKFIKEIEERKIFEKPIVTSVEGMSEFYPSENYHRDYYENNRESPYCRFVIELKLKKLAKDFRSKLKGNIQ